MSMGGRGGGKGEGEGEGRERDEKRKGVVRGKRALKKKMKYICPRLKSLLHLQHNHPIFI